MESTKHIEILKVNDQNITKKKDYLIVEYPFTILLNDKEIITLLSSPKSLKYLALGFLYSEGYIINISDVKEIQIDKERGKAMVYIEQTKMMAKSLQQKKTITSGSTKGTNLYNAMHDLKPINPKDSIDIKINEITSLIFKFNNSSKLFIDTGGAHSCALATRTEILMFEEDIARHNTFDKIIGRALVNNINFSDKIILTSGRISSEMLLKIAKVNIPVIISVSAPTDLSVKLARELNITLIGFARGERMNIYSNFSNFNF